ncbi:type IV pilus assembly PilZ [Solidesulfovibrio fructosivorans JJ]]|uniref:Type IV pilus assembly PilZ n=1 Tax=Solidesulfovibrio fructosivorans JJ] TaxID=596151 RepID=E1JYC2_SOLFR|nr:PilZ domain-containing protein [Solidesulfovibrio fructosivorans]EFL50696.1 type IV pilus assembly PilZ [Solidesulfovibrio fructosivorans JJ]]
MRMLLVVRECRARERFVAALSALGAECDVAASARELLTAMRHCRYNGVLFDVPTIVRTKDFDRKLLHALAEVYPSVRLRHDPATDAIFALGSECGPGSRDGLSVFVAACRDFLPRGLRRGERVDAALPAVLWRVPPRPGCDGTGGEKTCTTNISSLGCFVFSTAPWAVGDSVWVEFPDIAREAVRAKVAWHEPWGCRRAIPGVGLTFLEIPAALGEELVRLGCDPTDFEVASPPKRP